MNTDKYVVLYQSIYGGGLGINQLSALDFQDAVDKTVSNTYCDRAYGVGYAGDAQTIHKVEDLPVVQPIRIRPTYTRQRLQVEDIHA